MSPDIRQGDTDVRKHHPQAGPGLQRPEWLHQKPTQDNGARILASPGCARYGLIGIAAGLDAGCDKQTVYTKVFRFTSMLKKIIDANGAEITFRWFFV